MIDALDRQFRAETCRLEEFIAVVESRRKPRTIHATRIVEGVPSYDAEVFRTDDTDEAGALRTELARSLLHGPASSSSTVPCPRMSSIGDGGVSVDDRRATCGAAVAGDHFAAPGANDRVWNARSKLALADPAAFIGYYANDVIATVASAWLGPAYQITSQINLVNPGGQAQSPHRDYHLGFLSDDVAASYPPHVHRLSPLLTLQGAVAHCDMPSRARRCTCRTRKYEPGYVAWRRADFVDYFDRHHVQLPLSTGDAVFFNPAVFHAAGTNRTADVSRMANLLQISSAFGRAMESVDRRAMTEAIYPTLHRRVAAGMPQRAVDYVIAATAEGYPFPTNLDRDQPVDGLTPRRRPACSAERSTKRGPSSSSAQRSARMIVAQDRRRRFMTRRPRRPDGADGAAGDVDAQPSGGDAVVDTVEHAPISWAMSTAPDRPRPATPAPATSATGVAATISGAVARAMRIVPAAVTPATTAPAAAAERRPCERSTWRAPRSSRHRCRWC